MTKEHPQLDHLKDCHTRTLLMYLNKARKFGGYYDPFYEGNGQGFSIPEIKAELSTRPHIPNKKEARKIRQERAKKK